MSDYEAYTDKEGRVIAAGKVSIDESEYALWREQPFISGTTIPAWRIDEEGKLVPADDPRVALQIDVAPMGVSPVEITIKAPDSELEDFVMLSVARDGQERYVRVHMEKGEASIRRALDPGEYRIRALADYYGEASFIVAEDWSAP